MKPASLVPCPPSAGYSHECCMKPRQLCTQSKAAIKNAKSLELGPKDSADHRGLGRSSDERSSSLADPAISPAHAIHRRNDRGIGQRNRYAVETISAATEIGVHRTRNPAEFSRQHPGRNGNGHESGGPFPDCHHSASWATVCPGNNESAGKRRSGRTRQGNRWLRATLTQRF